MTTKVAYQLSEPIFFQAFLAAFDKSMSTSFHSDTSRIDTVQVDDAASLDSSLVSVWREIIQCDESFSHPHFCPEFAIAAGKTLPNVKVATLFSGNSPLGFFAFQQEGKVGWPVGYPFSETHGIVHRPGLEIDGLKLCREVGLSAWHFDHLPVTQTWSQAYQKAHDDAAWVELSGDFEAYLESRRKSGTSQLKQAERKRRKLAREVGVVRYVDQVTDREHLETMIRWKHDQTSQGKAGGVFESDCTREFLSEVLKIQEPNVRGQLSGLFADDRPVALHFGMQCRSSYVSMIPAHDPDFSRYSPGLILHLDMFRAACEQGVTDIDLGRGINRVKAALMTSTRKLAMGSVDRRPLRRFATNSWYRLRNFAHTSQLGNRLLMLSRQMKWR